MLDKGESEMTFIGTVDYSKWSFCRCCGERRQKGAVCDECHQKLTNIARRSKIREKRYIE